jgi:hypothetical protein
MTATIERSKLELLREQEATLAEQVELLIEKIAPYPEQIRAAREEAFYAKPSKRPLASLNSPLQKLIDAEKADVVKLNGLQADLAAVRQEDVRVREQETAEARAQLEQLSAREETVWQRAGELLGELAATWNDYIAVAEESDKIAGESGIGAGVLAVEPAPLSFRSFLLLLHTAATDPAVRAEPHVQELTETGNYNGRYETHPAGTKTTEVRRRLDERDVLYRVVPDLRSVVHRLQLSGRVSTIASE